MTPSLWKILIPAALALGVLASIVFGAEKYREMRAERDQAIVNQLKTEAQAHANAASQIQDHAQELAQAAQSVADLKAQLVRARLRLAEVSNPGVGVSTSPDSPGGDAVGVSGQATINAQSAVIAKQDAVIQAQDGQIKGLQSALDDEKKRSNEYLLAYQNEVKAAQAQQAATDAWKKAVTESRWAGRVEGFAVGLASGYLAGRLH